MTPNMIIFVCAAIAIVCAAAFFLIDRKFIDGFKAGMHQSKIDKLIRKQQKLTAKRLSIKAKAKKAQEQREELERNR